MKSILFSILLPIILIVGAYIYASSSAQQFMLRTSTSTLLRNIFTRSNTNTSQTINTIPALDLPKNMSTFTSSLTHATIKPRRSSSRGHADHGWLNTYHTFSFASYYAPEFESFGSLRVLNEDRVGPQTGFPTHPHRDYEIFSYVIGGELTHRDSMHGKGVKQGKKDDFFVMVSAAELRLASRASKMRKALTWKPQRAQKRGDVQFTTGGTGIAHSEQNEHASQTVHFLQIWAKPWARSLPPTYHTRSFADADKRAGFVDIISPLKGGPLAESEAEKAAVPSLANTIPIHADFLMGASIVPVGKTYSWKVGRGVVTKTKGRNVYVHVPMTKGGKAELKLDGRDKTVLKEGDGAFITGLRDGDELRFESVGTEEAEVVVLDSD